LWSGANDKILYTFQKEQLLFEAVTSAAFSRRSTRNELTMTRESDARAALSAARSGNPRNEASIYCSHDHDDGAAHFPRRLLACEEIATLVAVLGSVGTAW
jgi:hypothetical protein